MQVLCITRTPFIDRYACVRTLFERLGDIGLNVHVLGSEEGALGPPTLAGQHVSFEAVSPYVRLLGKRRRAPLTARLAWVGLQRAKKGRPACMLGVGAIGVCVAGAIASVNRLPSVAFCLELPTPHVVREPGSRALQAAERMFIRNAQLVVTQDEAHADFISACTGASRGAIETLPNASSGPARRRNRASGLMRGSAPRPVTILHFGGLGVWFESLELVRAASRWPSNWQLLMHTGNLGVSSPYRDAVVSEAKGSSVRFSTEPLSPRDHDSFVGMADIGIALYSVRDLGFRAELMGLASGKIGNYLKCGIPVIATKLKSVSAYLDQYGCGICVESANQIEAAILRIMNNYALYSDNAVRCFNELWSPERHAARIGERIMALGR